MTHNKERTMNEVVMFAKAVYDNIAEASDELEFQRDDIVQVLEQNHKGLDGWWLCSFQGRKGIAPGNRLVMLPQEQQPQHQPKRRSSHGDDAYDIPQSHTDLMKKIGLAKGDSDDDEYDIPRALMGHQSNSSIIPGLVDVDGK